MIKVIETKIVVNSDRTLNLQLPANIELGEHKILVVIDETRIENDSQVEQPSIPVEPTPPVVPPKRPLRDEFPVISVGKWPENLSLRREDMYGNDGR